MNHIDKTAVLAFCIALPSFVQCQELKPGRIKGLMVKLEKECAEQLSFLPRLTDSDKLVIADKVDQFRERSGWDRKPKHVLTYASFCLALLEDYHYPRITKIMVHIVDYFERDKKAPAACYPAGAIAKEKWEKIACG